MEIRNIDIFSPFIVVFGIFLYLSFAIFAFVFHINDIKTPSYIVFFYILFGTIFFLLGVFAPLIWRKYRGISESASKYMAKPSVKTNLSRIFNERFILALVLVGILLQFLNIYFLGGIPLLSGYLKAKAVSRLWLISYLIFLPSINILLAKYNKKLYYILFFIGLILFAVTGYRTTAMAIILSVFITTFYTINLKFRYFFTFTLIILVLGLSVGYIATKAIEWQYWNLNPFELLFYRAGFTLNVLDKITQMQGASGGILFYYTLTGFFKSVDPRALVGEVVLGYHHSITSTIFGPALLDFGYIALAVQMFIIGLVLKLMHSIQKIKKGVYTALYAIILAHTLLWIETGPTDLVVWIFFLMAIISLCVAWRWEKIPFITSGG